MSAIEDFVAFINASGRIPDGYTYTIDTPGPKFTRIVMSTPSYNGHPGQRSVHAFVENATGDLLKAAGWKAPAKGRRGNLVTGFGDACSRFDWAGGYLYAR